MPKPRVRLFAVGETMFRLARPDKGWGGPWGQTRRPAKWACIYCGALVDGDDEKPWVHRRWANNEGPWDNACARNGHAPCAYCGQSLPRLDDGCPRAHRWNRCPAKSEANRMVSQHAVPGHAERGRV